MNIFKSLYCRVFQIFFRIALPILPYRDPAILESTDAVSPLLTERGLNSVLLVNDKGVRGLGLTKRLEDSLASNGISCAVYDETVPNPTTDNVKEAR